MFEEQYKIITKDRESIEKNVLGCFLKDLSLYVDYKITESDFILEKNKFLFSVGKNFSKTYNEIEQIGIEKMLKPNRELRLKYREIGGYDAIEESMCDVNTANIDGYIDELYKNNFLIKRGKKQIFTKLIEIDGQEVNPYKDLFKNMTCKEVEEYFLGELASEVSSVISSNVKAQSLVIGDEGRVKFKEGVNKGVPYDVIFEYTEKEVGLSDSEEIKYIMASPLMSKETNGLGNGGGVTVNSGYSGIGKSTQTFFNMVLPMVYRGITTAIFSNEQSVEYFQAMLYCFVASHVFKYHKLTRRKISNGEFNEEEEKLMQEIDKFLEKRGFNEMLFYYAIEEFNVDEIMRITKSLIAHNSLECILIDTFKPECSSNDNYSGEMLESIKKLDVFGNKFQIKVICTMQLTPANEGTKSTLSAADLSESKRIKTVADLLFLMRKVVPEIELNPDNKKYYLAPYRYKKAEVKIGRRSGRVLNGDDLVEDEKGEKWERVPITFTPKELEYEYRIVFLNKSRRGADNIVMLYRMNTLTGRFEEIGYCARVYRGSL